MKKYTNFGDLLSDFRDTYGVSQSDLASWLNVDIRTVQRWERNDTLLKPEKEAEMVKVTLLPYQLVRNLNTINPIPTFYDFRLRKYSLSSVEKPLPDAATLLKNIDLKTERVHTIDIQKELETVMLYASVLYGRESVVGKAVLEQAVSLLPELNLYLEDEAGFYGGHCLILPLPNPIYSKLKKREIANKDIKASDLINPKTGVPTVFYAYSLTADSNTGVLYLVSPLLRFFRDNAFDDYLFASFTKRHDSVEINRQLGLKPLWTEQSKNGNKILYEGRFQNL